MAKGSTYDQQFKENAVRYHLEHPVFLLKKVDENLGISDSALNTRIRVARKYEVNVPIRGSGNYSSNKAKEMARLQRELRDTLEVLKKAISILGKCCELHAPDGNQNSMGKAIYTNNHRF